MKNAMKKLSFFFAVMVMQTTAISAAQITVIWDPNTEPELAGYKVYYGTTSRNYGQTVDVGNAVICALNGLTEGQTYYIAITAYDASGFESEYSCEVMGTIAQINSFDDSFLATGLALNRASGIVSGNVPTLPADPKSVFWAKSGLNVSPGQVLTLSGRMYYGGDAGPVSVYLADGATGNWLSPERVIYLDDSYSRYQVGLIVFSASSNAKLYIACGHRAGLYQFQKISIWLSGQSVAPVANLYLRQLLSRQLIGLYSAEWYWEAAPGSQGYVVRAALFREEIEKGAAGSLLTTQTLSPGQTSFRRDIDATLYGGVYLAVSSLVGGQESIPWITWYLPGDIYDTADDDVPPLTFQGGVDISDVNYAYAGYRNATRTPTLTTGSPAGREERTDIDNNTYAGRVSDYSFIRSQYLNGRRMR